jgi:HPt (histidine-containing phosphotransfer) domain-containing protein
MIVNGLDKHIFDLLLNPEGSEQDLQKFKALLEDLCKELKQLWDERDSAKSLVEDVIDDCLLIIDRPLEQHEWDEMKADQLKMLLAMAEVAGGFRDAAGWAAYSRDLEIRILFSKHELEKQMFFLNESLENLEGMVYRLLKWLNARNSLIQAYRNR